MVSHMTQVMMFSLQFEYTAPLNHFTDIRRQMRLELKYSFQ